MLLQVENTHDGYVVSGVFVDQDGCGRWPATMIRVCSIRSAACRQ